MANLKNNLKYIHSFNDTSKVINCSFIKLAQMMFREGFDVWWTGAIKKHSNSLKAFLPTYQRLHFHSHKMMPPQIGISELLVYLLTTHVVWAGALV